MKRKGHDEMRGLVDGLPGAAQGGEEWPELADFPSVVQASATAELRARKQSRLLATFLS